MMLDRIGILAFQVLRKPLDTDPCSFDMTLGPCLTESGDPLVRFNAHKHELTDMPGHNFYNFHHVSLKYSL